MKAFRTSTSVSVFLLAILLLMSQSIVTHAAILYSKQYDGDIFIVPDNDSTPVLLVDTLSGVKRIDVDPIEQRVYWAEGASIWRASIDGTGPPEEILVLAGSGSGLNAANSVAVDYEHGHIYAMSETQQRIVKAHLDGSDPDDFHTNLDSPGSIKYDPDTEYLYWTDTSTDQLMKADLQGNPPEPVATVGDAGEMVVDYENDKVFWSVGSSIWWADLSTGDNPSIFISAPVSAMQSTPLQECSTGQT